MNAPIFDLFDRGPAASLLDAARKTNAARDVKDRQAGSAAPRDTDTASWLRTAMTAIASGVTGLLLKDGKSVDLECVFEGLAMLQEIEVRIRPTY